MYDSQRKLHMFFPVYSCSTEPSLGQSLVILPRRISIARRWLVVINDKILYVVFEDNDIDNSVNMTISMVTGVN